MTQSKILKDEHGRDDKPLRTVSHSLIAIISSTLHDTGNVLSPVFCFSPISKDWESENVIT